jgi:hypothetical protein
MDVVHFTEHLVAQKAKKCNIGSKTRHNKAENVPVDNARVCHYK